MTPIATPQFPRDFKVLYADGGASYWHWHPDAPPDYEGAWPANEEPPPWAGGLFVYCDSGVSDDVEGTLEKATREGDEVVVCWEYGPELESGPYVVILNPSAGVVQYAVERVVQDYNEERAMAH